MSAHRIYWFKLIALSLGVSLLICVVSLALLRSLNAENAAEIRKNILLPFARLIENGPYPQSLMLCDKIINADAREPTRLWVITAEGQVLASNHAEPPPSEWKGIPLPQGRHHIRSNRDWMRRTPELILIRLATPAQEYLLIQRPSELAGKKLFFVQMIFFFLVSGVSLVSGLGMIWLYTRKNSGEAKRVLQRMQNGDLKARFTTHRFDQLGRLMLDFNHMADEIERLVLHVQATENQRRELLQELSHDLRTPLTSLGNAIELLTEHDSQLSTPERKELLALASGELTYFKRLIEDLFFSLFTKICGSFLVQVMPPECETRLFLALLGS